VLLLDGLGARKRDVKGPKINLLRDIGKSTGEKEYGEKSTGKNTGTK
jgi:hypothetical protein